MKSMKKRITLGAIGLLIVAITSACSPYAPHKHAPKRIAHKAFKVPPNFLTFQPRSGCGCH